MIEKIIKYPILKRLIPSLYKKFVLSQKKYFKEITFEGIIYKLDLRHSIDRRFFFHKAYEEELFKPMKDIISSNKIDYFFDIGSCWGLYSLRLSGIFKNLTINSFDPIKKNINRLNESIILNSIENINVFHTAIGMNKGLIKLGSTETHSPNYKINEEKSVISEDSPINSIDNLFSFKNKYLVLKIDTEGYEYDVLKGADYILRNNKCYCQIEITSNNKEIIIDYLKERNYRLTSINNKNKTDYIFSNFIFDLIKI